MRFPDRPSVRAIALAVLGLLLTVQTTALAEADPTPEDEQECLERTDPQRGQDPVWRLAHCPDDLAGAVPAAPAGQAPEQDGEQTAPQQPAEPSVAAAEPSEAAAAVGAPAVRTRADGRGGWSADSVAGISAGSVASHVASARAVTALPAVVPALSLGSLFAVQPSALCAVVPSSGLIPPAPIAPWAPPPPPTPCGVLSSVLVSSTQEAAPQRSVAAVAVDSDVSIQKEARRGDSAITQTDSGSTFQYVLTVSNAGPGAAEGVVVTDEVPSQVEVVSVSSSQGSCDPVVANMVSCALGTVAMGATPTVTITVHVPDDQCGLAAIRNTGEVSATNEPELNRTNNSDFNRVNVYCSEVHIEKTASPAEVDPGDLITYTIVVTNEDFLGGLEEAIIGTAVGVAVHDDLHDALVITSITSTQGSCVVSAGNVVDCVLGSIADQASATITIVARATTAAGCLTVPNLAQLTVANEYIGHKYDNDSAASVVVRCAPNLKLTHYGSGTPPVTEPGEGVSFTILVANDGTADALDTQVTDTIAPGITVQSASSDRGTCSFAGPTVTCALGTLPKGALATITVAGTATEAACPRVTSTAQASASNEPPGERGDNTGTVLLPVTCDSVLGETFGRGDQVLGALAATGAPLAFLALVAGLLAAGGGVLRSRGRRGRHG